VADLACGTGWSSIAMALAYPQISVLGLDLDQEAIAAARWYAAQAGVAGRVTFAAAAGLPSADRYDLVTVFEALHDMSRPVVALRAGRVALADGGTVLVVDGRVQEQFTASRRCAGCSACSAQATSSSRSRRSPA
jgi:2-polyprenyl-3-methyl-5-hydroxy-6-metoxy-1,4-benzoquinol methylase